MHSLLWLNYSKCSIYDTQLTLQLDTYNLHSKSDSTLCIYSAYFQRFPKKTTFFFFQTAHFLEVQTDFSSLVSELDDLQFTSVDLAPDSFRMVEKKTKRPSRKASTMNGANGHVRIGTWCKKCTEGFFPGSQWTCEILLVGIDMIRKNDLNDTFLSHV